ncbi:hypothetical protein CYY_003113 [Polysphondylium violaceum]|uniref:Ankyrin repeat-containing protein n=1 Tax=Polysphondylium violaceum TaxID=133409 RepID=A0A8J4V0F1_9MYCE|nr:hypothetical protein CYY_003113 [Polysphondylium violaceum]
MEASSETTTNALPQLHEAVINGDFKTVKEMIDSGKYNLEEEDFGGLHPLHFAARMGNIQIGEYLLDKGANINAENNFGSTPLHEAVRRGEVEFVKFLISRKVDLSIGDIDDNTPLHLAVMCEDGELIPMLLEAGAPLDAKNKDDDTPIQVTEDKEIIDYINAFSQLKK